MAVQPFIIVSSTSLFKVDTVVIPGAIPKLRVFRVRVLHLGRGRAFLSFSSDGVIKLKCYECTSKNMWCSGRSGSLFLHVMREVGALGVSTPEISSLVVFATLSGRAASSSHQEASLLEPGAR